MTAIIYQFFQTGSDDVRGAFRSIREEAALTAGVVEESFRRQVGAHRRVASVTTARRSPAATAAAAEERASEKAVEKAAKERKRAQDAAYRDAERLAAKFEREAEREASAAERAAQKRIDAERRANEKIAQDRSRTLGAIGAKARSVIGTGILTGGALFTGAVGAAARDEMRLQEVAQRISINARQAGEQGLDPVMLRKEFEATARANPGAKAIDVAAGVQKFITDTGDAGKAREFSGTFTQASMAAGGDLEAIASTGADLFQKFGIKTKEEMQEAFSAIYFGGKSGAFELADFSKKMAPIASAGQRFGVDKGIDGVKTMSGLTQIAMAATKNADVAATSVEATLRQLISKSEDLKDEHGVRVFDQKTNRTRNVKDVLVETIAKVGGLNAEKKASGLQKVFGDEGIKGITNLIATFNESAREAKERGLNPMTEGMKAVRTELERAMNVPGDWAEVQKDAAAAQSTGSAQLTAAWEQLKTKVGEELVPALASLIPKLTSSVDILDPFVEAVGLAVNGLVAMVDWLRQKGFLFDTKSHEERASDAERSLTQLNEKEQFGPLTKQQWEEREELKRKFIHESATAAADRSDANKPMTEAEFAERYMALSDPGKTTRARSLSLAATLARNPNDPIASNDFLPRVANLMGAIPFVGAEGGENEAQRDLRHRFQKQGAADPSSTGAGEVANLNGELVALTGAARAATRALAAVEAARRPSILAGQ